jgi:two-component sensor histidine kinase
VIDADAPIDRVSRHTARARLERLLFLAVAVAGVVYGALLFPGPGGIQAQAPQLEPLYAWFLVFVAILMPVVLGALTWILPRQWMRAIAGATCLVFAGAMVLFPFALTGDYLANDQVPWFQGIHALHAMIAAIVWQGRFVWVYAIVQGPIIGWVQLMVRPDSGRAAFLDAVGSTEFAVILMGAAVAVVGAADRQDRASERARAQAARGAATRTREREETRINAMVHDDIMSVLLTASRENPPASLADQARVALHSIATLDDRDAASREYDADEFFGTVQDIVLGIAPDAALSRETWAQAMIPAEVVSAMSDALGEALRNSVRHADPGNEGVAREVTVDIEADAVTVAVRDTGKGFNPRAVAQRRLGIRLSIVDRMALVPGGRGEVRSRPGSGTVVILTWVRPR